MSGASDTAAGWPVVSIDGRTVSVKLNLKDFELIVPSVEKAVGFYKDTLGLPMRFRNETFADFDLGSGSRLALWEANHAAQTCGEDAVGPRGNHMMAAIQMGSRQAIDEVYEELVQKGVNVLGAPKIWPWGAYQFYFKDPNDYLWEVYFWEMAPHTIES
jgi:uncharacterized protein